jgi:hypothetical protein
MVASTTQGCQIKLILIRFILKFRGCANLFNWSVLASLVIWFNTRFNHTQNRVSSHSKILASKKWPRYKDDVHQDVRNICLLIQFCESLTFLTSQFWVFLLGSFSPYFYHLFIFFLLTSRRSMNVHCFLGANPAELMILSLLVYAGAAWSTTNVTRKPVLARGSSATTQCHTSGSARGIQFAVSVNPIISGNPIKRKYGQSESSMNV